MAGAVVLVDVLLVDVDDGSTEEVVTTDDVVVDVPVLLLSSLHAASPS